MVSLSPLSAHVWTSCSACIYTQIKLKCDKRPGNLKTFLDIIPHIFSAMGLCAVTVDEYVYRGNSGSDLTDHVCKSTQAAGDSSEECNIIAHSRAALRCHCRLGQNSPQFPPEKLLLVSQGSFSRGANVF